MKIGLIGCGKMGSALLQGIAKTLAPGSRMWLSDVHFPSVEALIEKLGECAEAASAEDVAANADVIILAVKPHDMQALCEAQAEVPGERLYLSIAAGLTLTDLEAWLGPKQRVIRSMPNTPALVGTGAAAFSLGKNATPSDAGTAQFLLGAVGTADEVPERLLDAVTGLSGSGPAYVYLMIEALADGGVLMGLPRAAAIRLAAQTLAGGAKMVLETGKHTGALRDEVTSPGGTTIAGLEQLEKHGLRNALIQAVRSATEKAQAMGKK